MKWLKRGGIALCTIALILAIAPFFISLNDYIPRIEAEASARLQQPVKVKSLRLALLPLPHLIVTEITIGNSADLSAGKVTVTPDLWSLFGPTKVIRSITVDKLVVTQQAFAMIPADGQPAAKPSGGGTEEAAAVRIASVRLEDALVKLSAATLGPFDMRLRMDDSGAAAEANLASRDGKLKVLVKPANERFSIDASAKGWQLPVGPAVLFDELSVRGFATAQGASFESIQARLYGGTATGKAALAWDQGIRLSGSLNVSQVEVSQLLKALGRPPTLSGKLTAKPVFSASARKPEQLAHALHLATPFEVRGGVLLGVDIGKAAVSLLRKDATRGGETRFDKLSGHFALDLGTRRLTKLNVASGALAADGAVTISSKDELSGRVNATVKAGSIGSARVPLNVAGTLESPLLYPTGGTVAGAAVGAAILGPLGAGIGGKVGEWAEGLFRGRNESGK